MWNGVIERRRGRGQKWRGSGRASLEAGRRKKQRRVHVLVLDLRIPEVYTCLSVRPTIDQVPPPWTGRLACVGGVVDAPSVGYVSAGMQPKGATPPWAQARACEHDYSQSVRCACARRWGTVGHRDRGELVQRDVTRAGRQGVIAEALCEKMASRGRCNVRARRRRVAVGLWEEREVIRVRKTAGHARWWGRKRERGTGRVAWKGARG